MTERERFLETMLFGEPDRPPLLPGTPRESTLATWHRQGLPEGASYEKVLWEELGLRGSPSRPPSPIGVSFQMMPTFEEKVLERKDGHCIVQEWTGAVVEISDHYDVSYLRSPKDFVTRKWHRFPVQNRRDWENLKWRYDPANPERLPESAREQGRPLAERDQAVGISFNGPFWQLREWCGMEGLCLLMADAPDFVQEMIAFWVEFVSRTMALVLQNLQLDVVSISEDMAYKQHSMISPKMARRFLLPAYQRWVSEVKASGCPIISMDSDGYIGELLPLWIEAGLNCCTPVEVAAGNDLVKYRERFGKQIAYGGGLDKRAIAKGGQVMQEEVTRVTRPLLKQGGFIPGCDHAVPPDISWPDFVEYVRLLARLTGWL